MFFLCGFLVTHRTEYMNTIRTIAEPSIGIISFLWFLLRFGCDSEGQMRREIIFFFFQKRELNCNKDFDDYYYMPHKPYDFF